VLLLTTVVLIVALSGCADRRHRELDIVTRQIRSILEVPAYEHVYREVIYLGKEASFLGIRTQDKRLLFSVDMRVQAGIRLDRGFSLTPRGISAVDVSLPPAEILLVDADEESIRQFFILERGGSITHTEYYDEIEASKIAIREDALERGILEKAEENARELIRGILSGAGYGEIRFLKPGEAS
jgi:Protein of unknown function (DUF4230)